MEELMMEAVPCPECEGVSLYWNKQKKTWTAPYVDGAVYCDCPDELLDKLKQVV